MQMQNLRLQSFLSKSGISSRRKCEKLIQEGRVSVNGKIATIGDNVDPKIDLVKFDGKKVSLEKDLVYIILNKPKGYLVSSSDDRDRNVALDLVQPLFKQRLFSIGRLDYNSSGLIIYTNDGELTNLIAHPKYKVEKEYIVNCQKNISYEKFDMYKKGLHLTDLDGNRINYKLKDYKIKDSKTVSLTLEEGKNREIRNVFKYFKYTIRNLKRIRIANLKLGDLKEGYFKEYQKKEIYKLLGISN